MHDEPTAAGGAVEIVLVGKVVRMEDDDGRASWAAMTAGTAWATSASSTGSEMRRRPEAAPDAVHGRAAVRSGGRRRRRGGNSEEILVGADTRILRRRSADVVLVVVPAIVCQGREGLGRYLRLRQLRRDVGSVRAPVCPSSCRRGERGCLSPAGEPGVSMVCRNCSAVRRSGARYAAGGAGRCGGQAPAGSCPRRGGDGTHWCRILWKDASFFVVVVPLVPWSPRLHLSELECIETSDNCKMS